MAHYQKESHTVYDIEHHFVWVTKCRYHVRCAPISVPMPRQHNIKGQRF